MLVLIWPGAPILAWPVWFARSKIFLELQRKLHTLWSKLRLVDPEVVLVTCPTLTDQGLWSHTLMANWIASPRAGHRFSTHLVKFARLDSSCSFADVWWVAHQGREVAGRKTLYTLARSDQNFIHIAGLGWKLHTLWCRPRLVDALGERSKRTSVKSLYAWCAISSSDSLKILLYKYMCILQICYFMAFENG